MRLMIVNGVMSSFAWSTYLQQTYLVFHHCPHHYHWAYFNTRFVARNMSSTPFWLVADWFRSFGSCLHVIFPFWIRRSSLCIIILAFAEHCYGICNLPSPLQLGYFHWFYWQLSIIIVVRFSSSFLLLLMAAVWSYNMVTRQTLFCIAHAIPMTFRMIIIANAFVLLRASHNPCPHLFVDFHF